MERISRNNSKIAEKNKNPEYEVYENSRNQYLASHRIQTFFITSIFNINILIERVQIIEKNMKLEMLISIKQWKNEERIIK